MLNDEVSSLKTEYNNKIKKVKNLHNQKIDDLYSIIEDYKRELKRVNGLNGNLLHISKKRANQERNLRPKKSHNGFVILNMQSIPYKFYFNSYKKTRKPNFIEFECFKTKIQTPFDSSINLNLIKDEIINSFKNVITEFNIDIWYNYYSISNTSLSNLEEIIYNSNNNFIFKRLFYC